MNGRKLGRGLEDLHVLEEVASTSERHEIDVNLISPNPYQPRQHFDEAELEGLLTSIAENGILQPVVVRETNNNGYELIAGARRLQAARKLGMATIPVMVCNVSDEKALELALVENIQRKDLNPIEKAKAYKQLIDEFSLTQEELGAKLGQHRSTIANTMRLLELPEELQELVSRGTLSAGHARALLGIEGMGRQLEFARRIIKDDLSVRQTEELVANIRPTKTRRYTRAAKSDHVRALEDELKLKFGTRVEIKQGKQKGKIIIEFYSNDDFERILESMGLSTVAV